MKGFNNPPEAITRSYIATLVRVFVLAAFLITAVQSSADATKKATITVVNQSGQTIVAAYWRQDDYHTWDNVNLSADIPPGETHYINWTDYGNADAISLAFRLSDGTYRYILNVSIRRDSTKYVH